MLNALHVENYAIVEHLDCDFKQGMTTFTGETGAGKSIMIDALSLALGARTDSRVVRAGSKKCDITACFSIGPGSQPEQWLIEHDFNCDNKEVLLRRIITLEGRSKASINGQPVPLHLVRELSSMLVDIHGQHQHQTLLNHQTHRQQLDYFAGHTDLVHDTAALFKQHIDLQRRINELEQQQNNADRQELLSYQVDELNELALGETELSELDVEHQRLYNATSYLEKTSQLRSVIDEDSHTNLHQLLSHALSMLNELPANDSNLQAAKEMFDTALIQCQEASNEIKQFETQLSVDPVKLSDIEKRLETIHDIARKHHVDPCQLSAHHHALQEELKQMQQAGQELVALQKELIVTADNYQKKAAALTTSRQKHALGLSTQITRVIQQLGMPKGHVTIDITPLDKIHAHGQDRVEYKVCTNPGLKGDSLAKIASGGELSRISLAIQTITAQKAATPTLLFDEVDVGIGGATAAMVGQLLRQLAERLQVFCVTHQAQVASSAHQHFLVAKHQKGETTYSSIRALDQAQKIEEIARMLGGLTITENTRCSAKELLSLNT